MKKIFVIVVGIILKFLLIPLILQLLRNWGEKNLYKIAVDSLLLYTTKDSVFLDGFSKTHFPIACTMYIIIYT